MIKLIEQGNYSLIETKDTIKILTLDQERTFIWVVAEKLGEILINSNSPYIAKQLLSRGKYRLYNVKNEPNFTDFNHLELLVEDGKWQGYLLPSGLPDNSHKRDRIISTMETITKSIA